MYVLALPFQLAATLGWIAIPGTVIAGYIILVSFTLKFPASSSIGPLICMP